MIEERLDMVRKKKIVVVEDMRPRRLDCGGEEIPYPMPALSPIVDPDEVIRRKDCLRRDGRDRFRSLRLSTREACGNNRNVSHFFPLIAARRASRFAGIGPRLKSRKISSAVLRIGDQCSVKTRPVSYCEAN